MLSERAKQELKDAAASAALRADFAAMAANVRAANARWGVDDLVAFLTEAGKLFPAPTRPPAHATYTRALI